ncbi:hypothetical protein B0T22DRAFT_298100 [Podospora appendiculata]|uniref:Uncharacterized protein n=1 Tax=Podospora appendiculata TaxID=314037 RepID=A0AAE0X236_9PEZI|nr:hypothetical protein B0T22DRAFT_298100 [Podospora appendiculata]
MGSREGKRVPGVSVVPGALVRAWVQLAELREQNGPLNLMATELADMRHNKWIPATHEINKLKGELAAGNDELTKLRGRLTSCENDLAAANDRVSYLTNACQDLKVKLEEEGAKAEKGRENWGADIHRHWKEIDRVHKERDAERQVFEREKGEWQQERDQLQKEKGQLQKEKGQWEQERGQWGQERDQLQQENDAERQQNEALQQQLRGETASRAADREAAEQDRAALEEEAGLLAAALNTEREERHALQNTNATLTAQLATAQRQTDEAIIAAEQALLDYQQTLNETAQQAQVAGFFVLLAFEHARHSLAQRDAAQQETRALLDLARQQAAFAP